MPPIVSDIAVLDAEIQVAKSTQIGARNTNK
jgi:hypothetical protein